MECNVVFDSAEWTGFPGHSQMRIDFDDLKPKDKVVIRTLNSTYRFLITDPARRQGVLTGGAIGNNTREAVLIESFAGEDDKRFESSHEVRTGARVLFYLASARGAERMATSIIQELVVIQSAEVIPRIAC